MPTEPPRPGSAAVAAFWTHVLDEAGGRLRDWLLQDPAWHDRLAAALAERHPPPDTDQRPPTPAPLTFTLRQEFDPMATDAAPPRFRVLAHIPTRPEPNDIARQVLLLRVDGQEQPEVDVPLDATEFDLGVFPEGTTLSGEFAYIDRSRRANRSEASGFVLTIEDDEAPPKPGEFGLSVRQVFDEAPVDGGAAGPGTGATDTTLPGDTSEPGDTTADPSDGGAEETSGTDATAGSGTAAEEPGADAANP
jgi:hypothetical protein